MVRKQIVIDSLQEAELEHRARALGISQSEFVRRAIDRLLAEPLPDEARLKAWSEMKTMMDTARRRGVRSGGRKWTREELHERHDPR